MSWAEAWNWKSAVASSVCRASIFSVVNASAGLQAAFTAMQVEFLYRAVASGFYGSLTQRFARMPDRTRATWLALIVLPTLAHIVEFVVHSWAGTPVLGWSIAGSVAFSLLTTRFHLIAMRKGVLTVGAGSASWWQDLKALPAVCVAFFRMS